MERLKKPSELCQPDERNLAFVVLDPEAADGIRPSTPEDRFLEMEALALPAGLPEHITDAFTATRNLWLYGWFHWPFYSFAEMHAYQCIEIALRHRAAQEEKAGRLQPTKRRLTFAKLLQIAVKDGWITDQGFERFRQVEARRREHEQEMLANGWFDQPLPTLSPKEYSERLARIIPEWRNLHAHGEAPTANLFGVTLRTLSWARDIIIQLFAPVSAEPG